MEEQLNAVSRWLQLGSITQTSINLEALAENTCISECSSIEEAVVLHSLEFLRAIDQELDRPTEMISISLGDMKVVNTLIKIVVVYGIYPSLDRQILPARSEEIKWPVSASPNIGLLEKVVPNIHVLLASKNDLSDVIALTPFMALFLAGSTQLDHETKQDTLDEFIKIISTYDNYKYLIGLLAPGTPAWFRKAISERLAKLPYHRTDAVKSLVELFSGYRENEEIDTQKMQLLIAVFMSPPAGERLQNYLSIMDRQLFELVGAVRMPSDITMAACYLIDILEIHKPQTLKFFRDEFITAFTTSNSPDLETGLMALDNLLVRKKALPLVLSVGERFITLFWLLLAHLSNANAPNGSVLKLIVNLVNEQPNLLEKILQNLSIHEFADLVPVISRSSSDPSEPNKLRVKLFSVTSISQQEEFNLKQIDARLDYYVTILHKVDDPLVTRLFISLLREAIGSTHGNSGSPVQILISLKLLERMATDLRSQLFSKPDEIIDMCLAIVATAGKQPVSAKSLNIPDINKLSIVEADSDDEDDEEPETDAPQVDTNLVELCLNLLNAMMLELSSNTAALQRIASQREEIQALANSKDERLSAKAMYCLKMLETLTTTGQVDLGDDNVDYNNASEVFELAKSSLNDPLIPIRAHGLQLIKKLVEKHEKVVDLETALKLCFPQLKDEDSFIYLNAIQCLSACASTFGPNELIPHLLNYYNSTEDIDFALRIGETLTRILQVSAKSLTQETLSRLLATLLQQVRTGSGQVTTDDRLRMSAMSITGLIVGDTPLALTTGQVSDILDCCLGILRMESAISMQRSALVVLLECVNAVNDGYIKLDNRELGEIKTQLDLSTQSTDETVSGFAKDILSVL